MIVSFLLKSIRTCINNCIYVSKIYYSSFRQPSYFCYFCSYSDYLCQPWKFLKIFCYFEWILLFIRLWWVVCDDLDNKREWFLCWGEIATIYLKKIGVLEVNLILYLIFRSEIYPIIFSRDCLLLYFSGFLSSEALRSSICIF